MMLVEPILVAALFRPLLGHLLELLGSLAPEDWGRPTACSAWCVKDIASHLLDGDLRRLAAQRDRYTPPDAPSGFDSREALAAYIHGLNASWTATSRRISPRSLIRLLEVTGDDVAALFESADPFGPATFPVAWAGESESAMWFDVAREYTERWHHQRQIAEAVGRPTPIDARDLYHPVLDTFLRALPFAYRDVDSAEGTTVCVRVAGVAGGDWFLRRALGTWEPSTGAGGRPDARAILDQSVAWKVFTKRLGVEQTLARFPGIVLEGDRDLAGHALTLVGIMS